jgi:hypothetical protein
MYILWVTMCRLIDDFGFCGTTLTKPTTQPTKPKFNNANIKASHMTYPEQVPSDSHDHNLGGCIQKFPDWVDNEIKNNKHSLRSNTKGYGAKTH